MRRPSRLGLFLAAGLAATVVCSSVSAAPEDPFGGAEPVNASTLQTERGGFFTAGGQEFGFSAVLQTLIDGQVALTTTLTLQDNGTISEQSIINNALVSGNNLPTGATVAIPVNNAASLAAALAGTNVDLNGLSGTGLVLKSDTGVTAILDSIDGNELQNLVINTANGQNIVQNTAITITLPASSASVSPAGSLMVGLTNALQFSGFGH